METPSNYLPRPMRKLNQLYSRGYGGAPTPMSNPSRLEEPSVRLPQIGMLRHAGSVNPLIRGGAAISASRRALLEELQPHRPSAVSVLPSGSRGSGASRVSPMAPVRKLPARGRQLPACSAPRSTLATDRLDVDLGLAGFVGRIRDPPGVG